MYGVHMTEAYRRLTVNLTRKSSEALTAAHETEGLSKTDVINRALQLYHFTLGNRLAVVAPDGEVIRIHML